VSVHGLKVQRFSPVSGNIYLTIILRGRAGYQMIDNQRGAVAQSWL